MKDAIGDKGKPEGRVTSDNESIPIELHSSIFEPFVTTKISESGSGFGLYNTKIFIKIIMV